MLVVSEGCGEGGCPAASADEGRAPPGLALMRWCRCPVRRHAAGRRASEAAPEREASATRVIRATDVPSPARARALRAPPFQPRVSTIVPTHPFLSHPGETASCGSHRAKARRLEKLNVPFSDPSACPFQPCVLSVHGLEQTLETFYVLCSGLE